MSEGAEDIKPIPPFVKREAIGSVIDATGGKPATGKVLGGEIGYVRRKGEDQRKEIPEERRIQLTSDGMKIVAQNSKLASEGGVFEQASQISDPDERELFLEGAAEELARQETAPTDIRGGRAANQRDRGRARTHAYNVVKIGYQEWEKSQRPDNVVDFPTK